MAWNYYLNMELVALEIAQDAVNCMSDNNYCDADNPEYLDEPVFYQNLKHGFVAITMAACYFEGCINTILRDHLGIDPHKELMKSSINAKMEVIYLRKEDKLTELHGLAEWRDYNKAVRARNDLVHYKDSGAVSMSSSPWGSSWTVAKENIGDFFTKSNIEKCLTATKKTVDIVASHIGLEVAKNIEPIACDASGEPTSYLYNPSCCFDEGSTGGTA